MTDDYGVVLASDTVRIERMLPGPIELVWSYLTDSDKRRAWLAGGAMELRVGGRVEHVFRNSQLSGHDDAPPPKYAKHCEEQRMQGRITVCEPPHRLAYTWGANSQVSFELTARADKVHLVVVHRRLPSRDEMISVAGGWHAHLDILADRLSGRAPAPFWPTHTRLEAEYEQRIPK